MSDSVVRTVLLAAVLALYVGAGVVFVLLAASGPSLGVADTVSALAAAYASVRTAASLRASVDPSFVEVLA